MRRESVRSRARQLAAVDADDVEDDKASVRAHFSEAGYEIMMPEDAEEPILARSVRAGVFEWMAEVRSQKELAEVGLSPRKHAIFYGPPGTGKTTLAHHLAARLGMPLVLIGAESIIAKYLGESARNMAKLFDLLHSSPAPVIAFIDEFEALGRERDMAGEGSCAGEMTATLGVLLRTIETYPGIIIGATNRHEDIDKALWRRFDIQLKIDVPGEEERFAILRRYGLPFQFSDEFLDELTGLCDGASPALLRGLMEGIKRAMVMGPKINLDISRPDKVISRIIRTLAPPPALANIPLWTGSNRSIVLAEMDWPPVLPPKPPAPPDGEAAA